MQSASGIKLDLLNLKELIPVEEPNDKPKIIGFDDIKLDNKHMNKLKEYFFLSRNRNCNCIYLTLSYFDTLKYTRRITKWFRFFENLDNKDISHIPIDHAKDITRKELGSIYHEATEKPNDFKVLDKTAKHKSLHYRKCFDNFYA